MARLSDDLLETARRLRVIEDLSNSDDVSDELRTVLRDYVNALRAAVDKTHDEWVTAIQEAFRGEGR